MKGCRRFSVLELVATVGVMAILITFAAPAVDQSLRGTGVTIAARDVGTQLHLARQYAQANRRYVALIMPGENAERYDVRVDYLYTTHRIAFVLREGSDWVFDEWVPSSQWRFIRKHVSIMEADDDIGINNTGIAGSPTLTPRDNDYGQVQFVDLTGIGGTSDGLNIRALIFSPAGRVKSDTRFITIGDAVYSGSWIIKKPQPAGTSSTNESSQNQVTIEINRFTGGASYWEPQDY